MKTSVRLAALVALVVALPAIAGAGELRGSIGSMRQQHGVAVREDYAFTSTRREIQRMVEAGELVPVEGNADYVVDRQVPHRFARPEIRLFLERLGAQYHQATGMPLVVTSLVRPQAEQPRNAHKLSVHPVGMAIDFRVPADAKARAWLEKALLAMEDQKLLDVTRERRPPHYHVAVFPAAYMAYAARMMAQEPVAPRPEPQPAAAPVVATADAVPGTALPGTPFTPLSLVIGGIVLAFGSAIVTRKKAR